jgi:hypothetical protein
MKKECIYAWHNNSLVSYRYIANDQDPHSEYGSAGIQHSQINADPDLHSFSQKSINNKLRTAVPLLFSA